MSRWIDHPAPPLVVNRARPLLVETAHLDELRKWFKKAHQVEIDIAGAERPADVIDALKGVLEFPDWCGSTWDSIDDAFQELVDAWQFPLLLVVRRFDRLLRAQPHVALNAMIHLDDMRAGFSAAEDQLIVVFEGAAWAREP
jgi:hypothetical protein